MTIYAVCYTSDQQLEMVADLVEAIGVNEATMRMHTRLMEMGHTDVTVYAPTEIKSPKRVKNVHGGE